MGVVPLERAHHERSKSEERKNSTKIGPLPSCYLLNLVIYFCNKWGWGVRGESTQCHAPRIQSFALGRVRFGRPCPCMTGDCSGCIEAEPCTRGQRGRGEIRRSLGSSFAAAIDGPTFQCYDAIIYFGSADVHHPGRPG